MSNKDYMHNYKFARKIVKRFIKKKMTIEESKKILEFVQNHLDNPKMTEPMPKIKGCLKVPNIGL